MRRERLAKIVATLGPASSTREQLLSLFHAGVDVFRLNLSHGTHEDHRARHAVIREIEAETGRPISILVDLQGPKIRVGQLAGGEAQIERGQPFRLDLEDRPGDSTRVRLPHPEVLEALTPGADLLIDDGRLRLKVERVGQGYADTTVLLGGRIKDRKGVNLPGILLPVSPLTEKDRRDLAFALDLGVDWIALSFVQRPEDVAEARRLVQGRAAILVKLEKPSAIDRLEELLDLADAAMVARGDLGVEMPPEDVPSIQKRIVATCRLKGKPVVVATQMLESMVMAPAPTRAEASDCATAVYDGADALMLSAETASGNYPIEAVSIMNRIIERVERDPLYRRILAAQRPEPEATAADAITYAAQQVAHTISAAAIVTYTTSGSTTFRAARERPEVPILCLTSKRETARRLALVWGVHCIETPDVRSFSEMVDKACRIALAEGFAKAGQRLVVTAGVPFGTPGSTNVLRIAWVDG
ncbi:MAG TPA: pyruvate kinase [Hypericibacter adhaerens]|uniref:Pyruvate kinase n=1 Tax=Hypericibacter adhaerens TaxID=2602016 RepID=A0A5J6N3V4_9PROT|nr:pyruvate kinase [Hypericibacter adhaerens]QEX24084.1 pyruvate kinase [Hypericibacter adhaerens]HWA45253.1 pyruvate kinase [Hypericibacter adhaerens]